MAKEKTVGIIGGMGPEATVDLMQRIIDLTPAKDDIDHIHCLVDNNPKIPSRIKAIIEGYGEDPGPFIAQMGKRLESWGADFLVIPCNTAHYYYDVVQNAVKIPVVNLIDLVINHIESNFRNHDAVGILASPAVAMTGLYTKPLKKLGFRDIWPDSSNQERLFQVIRQVKQGNTGTRVMDDYKRVCENLAGQDAQIAIVGCTELSALGGELPIKVIDAAHILAREIVLKVKYLTDI